MTEPIADFPQTMPEPLAASYELPMGLATQTPSTGERLSAWLGQLTVADGLVVLAIFVAAVLRFRGLGQPVLSPAEASAALSSWQFSHAGAIVIDVASPAYFTLTNAAMLLFGSSDAIARLVPALLGTITVGLIWCIRRSWQPAGMLAVAVFLALSPLNILASRTAGGAAIAIFALMLLVVSSMRLTSDSRRSWAFVVGVALGLGLTSAPLFLSGLVGLVPMWVWLAAGRHSLNKASPIGALSTYRRPIAIAFGVSYLLLSTSFFLYTPGIGASIDLLVDWLGSFGLPSLDLSGKGFLAPILTTLRYEPALIVLGFPALIWALAGRTRVAVLMAGWWIVLVALALFQPASVGSVLLFTLPGYLLIGLMARALFAGAEYDYRIMLAVAGGLLLLGMILLVSMARYTRLALWSSDQVALLVLALVALTAAGGVLVLAMSYNSRAARQGAFLGLAVLMLYLQWGTATAVTQLGANDPRERVVTEGTDDDLHVMSELLRDISRQTAGGDYDLEIVSTVDSPALRWYLRNFERAHFGDAIPLQANPEAVITPAGTDLRIGADYLGADFGLRQYRTEVTSALSLNDSLKWLLFRESTTPVEIERVILWIRSDLTGAGRS